MLCRHSHHRRHGGGLTNMVFLPPGSTVVELIGLDQKGAVYGEMATELGHRYLGCTYNRTTAQLASQLPSVRAMRSTMRLPFVVDVPALLGCMARGHAWDGVLGGTK